MPLHFNLHCDPPGQTETAHSNPVKHWGTRRDTWASPETPGSARGVGQEGEGPWGWGAAQSQCSVCLPQHSGSFVAGTGVAFSAPLAEPLGTSLAPGWQCWRNLRYLQPRAEMPHISFTESRCNWMQMNNISLACTHFLPTRV